MVDKTPLEIKQDNATAQLNVIKVNIQVANDELSGLLSTKETIESELGSLKEESVRISELNAKADKDREDKDSALEAKRIAFEQSVDEFNNKKADFDNYVSEKNKEIDDKKTNLESTIINLNDTINKLEDSKSKLESYIDSLEKQVESNKEEISLLISEKNTIDSELAKAKDEYTSFINNSKKEKEIYESELESVKQKVQEEKDKIKLPFELHNQRVAEFERRERNFKILFTRFKKEFKRVYPNQEPNI